jgi:hypothetical protein
MKARTSLILVVLAVLMLGGGWYLGLGPGGGGQTTIAAGTPVFPGLAPKLATAARIEVVHQGQTLHIDDKDGHWGLADKAGYPVQADKLRAFFTGLADLRLTEPRTSDPSEYNRLGVEDPSATATSTLVRVLDGAGQKLAELIVGHRRVRTQGEVPDTIYVRRPGEAQAWLAEGNFEVDSDPQLWIARDIANIANTKIAQVAITRGDQTLNFAREGDKLVLKSPADHPKLDDYKVEDVARAYESLTLTDVKPAAQEPGEKIGSSVFTTTDGEAVTATVFKVGTGDKAEIWAQFAVAGDGAAKADADALRARTAGWSYQLGAWKEKALAPALDDLKADEPAAPAAPSPATPAPAPVPMPPDPAAAPK